MRGPRSRMSTRRRCDCRWYCAVSRGTYWHPGSKATTTEIWDALSRTGVDGRPINDALKGHIAQILDATDRLKFARVGGGASFFQSPDAHFGVIMQVTRPVTTEEGTDGETGTPLWLLGLPLAIVLPWWRRGMPCVCILGAYTQHGRLRSRLGIVRRSSRAWGWLSRRSRSLAPRPGRSRACLSARASTSRLCSIPPARWRPRTLSSGVAVPIG